MRMVQWMTLFAALALVACGQPEKTDPEMTDPQNAETNNTANANPNNQTVNGEPGNLQTEPTVTYYEDVKPIVDARCAECHVDGGIGPFPLDSYEAVDGVKDLVANVVETKQMPPFIYDNRCNEYKHDPTLSDEQKQVIADWVEQGAAEGDPAAEGEPLQVETPEPPDFDTNLPMPVEYTPQKSPDDYRCFVIDWPHDTRKFLTGFGVNPGDPEIVHHVIAFLAPPDSVADAEALDEAEEGPGYTCFGGPGFTTNQGVGWLGSWAPGGVPSKLPQDTGIPIEPGSKVVLQVHYNTLTTDPAPDLTSVDIETSDAVEKEGVWMPWANPAWLNGAMTIPAGESDAMHRFMYDPTQFMTNGQPINIWGGGLHMHLLGTRSTAWIQRQNGDQDCIVDVPRWDFNWQTGVDLAEPMRLEPGDQLALECHWDNSMENQPVVDGEKIAPDDRGWGEGTTDEMCLGIFYVTTAD